MSAPAAAEANHTTPDRWPIRLRDCQRCEGMARKGTKGISNWLGRLCADLGIVVAQEGGYRDGDVGPCHPEGGRPVANEGQHPVVILYEHALLGEGIAKYLRAQLGVEAMVVSAFDLQAVTSALALGPAVVIFELTEPLKQVDLTTLAPHAVLIDVSTVVTRGAALSPDAAGLEKILQAVRDSARSTGSSRAESAEAG